MQKTALPIALFFSLSSCLAVQSDELALLHSTKLFESDWHFVHDIFVKQPRDHVHTVLGTGGKIASCALAVGIGLTALWRYAWTPGDSKIISNQRVLHLIGDTLNPISIKATVAALTTYVLLYKKALRDAEAEQMEKVLNSWNDLKQKFPAKLHDALDILSRLRRSGSEDYPARRRETIRLMKDLLAKQIPDNRGLSLNWNVRF